MPDSAYRRLAESHRSGGLESKVDAFAWILLSLSCLMCVLIFVVAFQFGLPLAYVYGGIALLNGGVAWVLLRAVAEHLRLQKKIAGLPFAGEISKSEEVRLYQCTACNHWLHSIERCDYCGATILGDEDQRPPNVGPSD